MRGIRCGSSDDDALGALQAELALLREENARLKVERQRRPDAGHVVERLREIAAVTGRLDDFGDDAWHVLTETVVIRETLLDVCREIEHAMVNLQNRLSSTTPAAATDSWLERSARGPLTEIPTPAVASSRGR